MIDWTMFLFILGADILGDMFNFTTMLTVNLPIVLIAQIIFMIGYYLNYVKFPEKYAKDNYIYWVSAKEGIYFFAKNAAIIVLGFIHLYIAFLFATYYLMCAGVYFRNLGARKNEKRISDIGNIIYTGAPIALFGLAFMIGDLLAFAPIVGGYIIFMLRGQNYAELSLKELHSRYQRRIINRLSGPIQVAIIVTLVLPPLILFTCLGIWGISFFEGLAGIVDYLLDVNLIISVNLPIILIARLIYLYVFYLTFIKYAKKESGESIIKVFSKNQRLIFITSNILILLFSALFIYVAVFFAVYSLLVAASRLSFLSSSQEPNLNLTLSQRLRGRAERTPEYSKFLYVSVLLFLLIPFVIIYATLFYPEPTGIIPIWMAVGLALPLFIFKGSKYGNFSVKDFVKRYFRTARRNAPNYIKYFTIIYLVVVPVIVLYGLSIGDTKYRKDTIMLEMRDGVFLATDIYYSPLAWDYVSNKPLPAPVILVRTPYGKGGMSILYDTLYTSQGYHVVIQDFRGCHDSEGSSEVLLFTKDYQDAPDTIEWIRKQSWCNGKVGSSGISALCVTQYLYAGMNPQGLLTQSLWFGTPDLLRDAILEGAFHQGLVYFWIKGVGSDNWRDQMDVIFDYMNNLSRLDEIVPRSVSLEEAPNTYEKVNVSALHIGGWYDHFLRGTIRGYTGYDDRGDTGARGRQKMIIGPWTHGMVFTGSQGELEYPANANAIPLILRWEQEIFDEALLGVEKDIWSGDRVAYYLMGDVDDPTVDANYWKFTDDWPLNNSYEEWFFGVNNAGDQVVVKNGVGLQNENISYIYDPRNPVETRGGNNEPGYTSKGAGPFDQRPTEEVDEVLRGDVIRFESAALEAPLTFEGDLVAQLFIKSNCTDTDFMIKLTDIYPDGRRMLIIDSAKTTRFWKNQTEANFITPNQAYNFTIEMPATAYQFNTGHKIGITIQSSNYDRFALNANTGGRITDHYSESFIANNTIITGPGLCRMYFPKIV